MPDLGTALSPSLADRNGGASERHGHSQGGTRLPHHRGRAASALPGRRSRGPDAHRRREHREARLHRPVQGTGGGQRSHRLPVQCPISGPHYHLPWPIETVVRPSVTAIRKEELGFRTTEVGPPARYRDVEAEALMLTGDENIVKLDFIVQYKVRAEANGVTDFLFNARSRDRTITFPGRSKRWCVRASRPFARRNSASAPPRSGRQRATGTSKPRP